jgi:HSF-type DNA-binding
MEEFDYDDMRAAIRAHALNSWFRQKQWASFQRQLNHYGFKRISTGT